MCFNDGSLLFCRVERSTDQVVRPVNTDALSKWVGNIPSDVLSDMAEIAPMLSRLGYDPHANPPDYTRPEPRVSLFNLSNLSRVKPTHWTQRISTDSHWGTTDLWTQPATDRSSSEPTVLDPSSHLCPQENMSVFVTYQCTLNVNVSKLH